MKRLLDLFCGAGGASRGYQQAGYEVTGVDLAPQPRYAGDHFIQADVLALDPEWLRSFDVIHASPPCQEYSATAMLRNAQGKQGRTQALLEPVREMLIATGKPYVIENVPRAPLVDPVWLCGSMFSLRVWRHDERAWRPLRRHRGFESNVDLPAPADLHRRQGRPLGVYGSMRDDIPQGGQTVRSLAEAQALMGIDWMRWDELKEAVPPAYAEWVGLWLLAQDPLKD